MSRDRALRRYSDILSRSRHAPTRSVVFILERGAEQQGPRGRAAATTVQQRRPGMLCCPEMSRDRALRRYSDIMSLFRHSPTRSVVFIFSGEGGRTTGHTPAPAAATTVQQRRPGMLCCPEMSRDRALRRYGPTDILSRSRHAPTRSVVFILERGAEQQSTRRPAAASPRLSNSGDGPLHYAPCWPVRPELVQIDSARRRCCALRLRSCQTRKHRVHWMLVVARSGRCVIAFPGMTRSKPERAAPSTGRVDLRRAWSRPRL